MEIKFKLAAPEEWKIIQTIAHATWPVTFGQLLSAGQLEYMLDLIYSEASIKQQMEREHQFSIGYHAGAPFGFASVEKQYKSTANFMIHKLYLLPSFLGKGIGKAFLDHMTVMAAQSKHDTVMLKVFVKNQNAIRFYQRQGFHVIGEEVSELGRGYTVRDYVMIKEMENCTLP